MYLKYKIVNVFFIFLLIQIGFLKSYFRKKGQCHQIFYLLFSIRKSMWDLSDGLKI